MKKFFVLIILLVFVSMLISQVNAKKMVNFKLNDLNGKSYELDKMLGKGPIVIDFWATWCEPCLKELPDLSELQKKYKGITVIAISVDKARMLNKVKREVKSHRYKFLTLFDKNGAYQRKMNIKNIPQTYLLDKKGNIVYHHEGFDKKATALLEKEIKKLLPTSKLKTSKPVKTKKGKKEEK